MRKELDHERLENLKAAYKIAWDAYVDAHAVTDVFAAAEAVYDPTVEAAWAEYKAEWKRQNPSLSTPSKLEK